MNPLTGASNGHNETLELAFTPGQTLNPELAAVHSIGPLTTTRPRASFEALEAFRTLALSIESLADNSPICSIALFSAVPGEGRSLSAELLSLALSELRPPVRLLDADPFRRAVEPRRRRRLLRATGTRADVGATEGGASPNGSTTNGAPAAFARIPVAQGTYPGPAAFLQHVRHELDAAVATRAQVLVDVPACSLTSIAFSIAQMVDAAIYVVRPDRGTLEAHQEVLAQAILLKIKVLGILLNEG
jgi:Mrp family chromosome partitioning ATPase